MNSMEFPGLSEKNSEEKYIDFNKLIQEMRTPIFRDEYVLRAFAELVKNLGEKLSTFDTILSDDTSGRLVSLILRKVVDEARKRKGLDNVKAYFLATGQKGKTTAQKSISDFLESKKTEIKKALVVTEHISTGESIKTIVNILDNLNIDFNIATISARHSPEGYDPKIAQRLYYGGSPSKYGLSFYNRPSFIGVEKVFSATSPHPTRKTSPDMTKVNDARADAKRFAETLIKSIL